MLPEDREARMRCYRNALRNWNFDGYVRFKRVADEWLANEFPESSERERRRSIARVLCEHVENGGQVDEQKETRAEYSHYEFHFDLRVMVDERRIYFETILLCDDPDDPDDPVIEVVSVHDV